VDDMRAILDHLHIEQAIIAGHSLGGFMSLAFHAAYPQRVQALLLQGCGPGYRRVPRVTGPRSRSPCRAVSTATVPSADDVTLST
jgi:pimeloyl-ACP methyl ester carboxylesterase